MFLAMKKKEKHPIDLSKQLCGEEHVDLLLKSEAEKKHYVLIKDFNTLMYYQPFTTSWKEIDVL